MATSDVGWAYEQRTGNPVAKHLLVLLADNYSANEQYEPVPLPSLGALAAWLDTPQRHGRGGQLLDQHPRPARGARADAPPQPRGGGAMSFEAWRWSLEQDTPSHNAWAVLVVLANRANKEEGACWPGQALIAEDCQLSERAVRRALIELEEAKLIEREKRYRRDGNRGTDKTYLLLNDGARVAAGEGRADPGPPRHEVAPADYAPPDSPSTTTGTSVRQSPDSQAALEPVRKNQSEEPVVHTPPAGEALELQLEQVADHGDDLSFQRFYERFPRRDGRKGGGEGSVTRPRRLWDRMSRTDRLAAMAAVDNYRAYVSRPHSPYPCYTTTWLRQRRWEEHQQPPEPEPDDDRRDAPRTLAERDPTRGWETKDRHNAEHWIDPGAATLNNYTAEEIALLDFSLSPQQYKAMIAERRRRQREEQAQDAEF